MENINEENPYEIYSKTMYRLNITVANIDPTDIDSIIGRLKLVMDTIDLGKFTGETLFTLGGIIRDAKSILDMACELCELQSDFHVGQQKFLMRLKALELATIGFKGMVSDLWKTIHHPLFDPDPYIPHVPTNTTPESDNIKRKYPAPPPYEPTQSPFWCDAREFATNLLHKYRFHA